MLALRFYVDKKNGDHSRVIDVRELDEGKARPKVTKLLKKGEVINQAVSITVDDPDFWEFAD